MEIPVILKRDHKPEVGDIAWFNGAHWIPENLTRLLKNRASHINLTHTVIEELRYQIGAWLSVDASQKLSFTPDYPAVQSPGGSFSEYGTIVAAIAAASSGDRVVIPPGEPDESITLKNGVYVVEAFPGTVILNCTTANTAVTTVSGGYIKVHEIRVTRSVSAEISAVLASHASGTCVVYADLIRAEQSSIGATNGINQTGAGTLWAFAERIQADGGSGNTAAADVEAGTQYVWAVQLLATGASANGYGASCQSTGVQYVWADCRSEGGALAHSADCNGGTQTVWGDCTGDNVATDTSKGAYCHAGGTQTIFGKCYGRAVVTGHGCDLFRGTQTVYGDCVGVASDPVDGEGIGAWIQDSAGTGTQTVYGNCSGTGGGYLNAGCYIYDTIATGTLVQRINGDVIGGHYGAYCETGTMTITHGIASGSTFDLVQVGGTLQIHSVQYDTSSGTITVLPGSVPTHTHTAGSGGQLDWDNVWADAVHDHSAAGEGGAFIDLNGAADALVLDADGDTSISAPTGNQIDFEANNADQVHLVDGNFYPDVDNDVTLGDATHRFSSIYAHTAMYIGNDNISRGVLHLYGTLTPSEEGGAFYLYTSTGFHASIDSYYIRAWQDDLLIEPAGPGGTTFSHAFRADGSVEIDGTLLPNLLDLNGIADGLVLDADADTSISAPTDDQIDFEASNADQIHLSDGKLWPTVDNDIDLGDSTHYYKNAYIKTATYAGTNLHVGINDTTKGNIMIYGHGAGQLGGGSLFFFLSADYDGTIDYMTMQAYEDDFILQPSTGTWTHYFRADGSVEIGGTLLPTLLDMNGIADGIVLDADGDTSISAPTDDQIDFECNNADQIHLSDGKLWPTTDDDIDLGDATHEFKDGYFDGIIYTDLMEVSQSAISTTAPFTGANLSFTKTAGATDLNDTMIGLYDLMAINQAGGEVGNVYGISLTSQLVAGTIGNAIGGARSFHGMYMQVDLDGGTITGSARVAQYSIDQEAANTITGDAYGLILEADLDGTVSGLSYMLYFNELTGVDYCIYQNGTAYNYLGGDTGIGVFPDGQLHVDQSSTTGAQPVLVLDQADVDVVLMKIIGTAQAASADRTLVKAGDFPTPGSLAGWIQVNIQDDGSRITNGDYWIPFYNTPT